MRLSCTRGRQTRTHKGNITVLSAIMMVSLFAVMAFAIDLSYLSLAREELQRTADSSALAAAWELVDTGALTGSSNANTLSTNARTRATQYAASNQVLRQSPGVATQDIEIGYLSSFANSNATIDLSNSLPPNAARVIVRRTSSLNGRIPFFLAPILGVTAASTQAEATAAILNSFGGFRAPPDGTNLDLLPFALDLGTWTALMNGTGSDNWKWNSSTSLVESGSDGIKEVNLYPQGTGSPGNRGTVDIGSSNNSTADITRQILYGVSAADLAHHGGTLQFDSTGVLMLNGDTGISAGVKDDLNAIKGRPRVIPIFSNVSGPGNNAQYTIVRFVGVRIMEVVLTGKQSSKRVTIQPANIMAKGGIPSSGTTSSQFVYSPALIIR